MTRNLSSSLAGSGSLELVPVAGEYISFDAFLVVVVFFTVVGFAVAELFVIVDAHDFVVVIGVAVVTGFGAALIGLGATLTGCPVSLLEVTGVLAGFEAAFAGLPADVAVCLVVDFAAGFAAGFVAVLAAGLVVGLVTARAGFATAFTGLPADLAGFAAGAVFFAGVFVPVFDCLAVAEPATFFAGTELFEPAPFVGKPFEAVLFFEDLAVTGPFFLATGLAAFAAVFDCAGCLADDFVPFAADFFVFFAAIIVFGFQDSEKMIEITCLLPCAPVLFGTSGR
jgi:hypothetical protein